MAFIVEDGTGLPDANAYVDLAFALTYFEERGREAEWTGSIEQQEQWIINATDYADVRWGLKLKSKPLLQTQSLEIPRYDLRDRYGCKVEGVPIDWARGICEYAVQAKSGRLTPAPTPTDPRVIKKTRITVGPITTDKEFTDSGSNPQQLATFPMADRLCGQYATSRRKTLRN